jgi:predicted MPP superfamily phosphohydrolase
LNVTHPGLGRVKKYDFVHKDVPASFNGFTIAFISDLHYKSKFTEKRLRGLVKTINKLHPDLLLMGGDYQEGCQFVNELCACLSE